MKFNALILFIAVFFVASCSSSKKEFTVLVYANLPSVQDAVQLKINSSSFGSIQNQNIELTLNDSTLEQYCFITQLSEGKYKVYATRENGTEITGSKLTCRENSLSSSSINGLGGGMVVQSRNDSILIRFTE